MHRQSNITARPTAGSRHIRWPEQAVRPLPVAPVDWPELPMLIEFEGLTLAELRAALAAFPSGRRFVLLV